MVGVTIVRPLSGYSADTSDGRRTMLGPLAVTVTACVTYMWVASLPTLVVIRIIYSLTYALVFTAVTAAARTATPASRRAEGTGYISLGTILVIMIDPAPGLTLIGSAGYSVFFVTASGLSIVGLMLALSLP